MFMSALMMLLVLVIGLVGLALPIYALVRLAGVPQQQLSIPVWAWALIIICAPFLGSIAFLVVGER